MEKQLVLASGSSYKRALMERLGLAFEAVEPDVVESSSTTRGPEAVALENARAKALAVAPQFPGAWVIGADQVIALGSRLFGKPGGRAAAERQLMELSGAVHSLTTAVCVLAPSGVEASDIARFEMSMRNLTEEEIAAYVAEEEPYDCAGAYRVEAGGIRLFRSLRGDDYTAIVGLPLTIVRALLEQTGFFRDESM